MTIGALMAAMLLLNLVIWKRRGRGWRTNVDAFVAVIQPYVPEPVLDAVVLQPAGTVGRDARAEQGRGLKTLYAGMTGGELNQAMAEHRAGEQADAEGTAPMTALAVGARGRYLLPVTLANGRWSAGKVERKWGAGEASYDLGGRALTIQVTITNGDWTGRYEIARDPASYNASVLQRLTEHG